MQSNQVSDPNLSARELWNNIMHHRGHDRMPVMHWIGWPETNARWRREGMPGDCDIYAFLKAAPYRVTIRINVGLYPPFAEETLEETAEWRIYRAADGVVQQAWKNKSGIPHYIDFTLKDARNWDEYKKRLQPHPDRIPANVDEQIAAAEASGSPIFLDTGSLMGWIRNWMGVESMCYLMFDAPEVYADMVNTLADLACWGLDQVIPRMHTRPDMGLGWEDICGKNGPLINPDFFQKYVSPGYIKIRNKLEEYGVDLLGVDSDGDITALIRPWLDSGVNVMFPFEIGTWDADPVKVLRQYGRDLRIFGGYNKYALEKGPAAIDAELERRLPAMKLGGYVILSDHFVTPDTPLANFQYYLDRLRTLRF